MTLDKVRVHLSDKTAGVHGIGFVACTRVRHPWDLVFEEDLPEYGEFMKAKRTPAFRERKRFELRARARASRTLRKYGYCEADVWTEEEARIAGHLLDGLRSVAGQQEKRLKQVGYFPDADTWLWGDAKVDFVGELSRQVRELADGDEVMQKAYESVAERLLDRTRVRSATSEEKSMAEVLVSGEDFSNDTEGSLEAKLA